MKTRESFAEFPSCFWAKKNDNGGIFKWLSLKQHSLDTMNVAGLLWEHWLSDGQKKFIMSSLNIEYEEAKQFIKFLGAIHDIGKATPVFQTKKNHFSHSADLHDQLMNKLIKNGFQEADRLNLIYTNESHHALASQVLLSNFGVKDDIGSIAGAHHGRPIDEKGNLKNQIDAFAENYFQIENPTHPTHLKWKNAQEDIFHWALNQNGYNNIDELPVVNQSSQVILSGLVIMADWISSNEDYFPLMSIEEDTDIIDQQKRLENGWTKWLKTRAWKPDKEDDIIKFYKERFCFNNPNNVQIELAKIIQKTVNPGIFIVEAPMGVGKTEAALAAVELLSAKTGRSGMFFGLPTQATSDGIFKRIQTWLKSISKSSMESTSLQLVHGKASLNKDFSSMAKNIDPDGENDSGVMVNEWFSSKKTAILDDFVVGTVDHFLLSALKQRHLALRHLGFSKKVVVIDEVHAYDAYMGQYLYRALYWMGAYRVPVIILSATLPAKRRRELLEAYARGTGQKMRDVSTPQDWETSHAYPLITYLDGDVIFQLTDFDATVNKQIEVKQIGEDALGDILEERLSNGGIAGIVVNTVKRAQQFAKELSLRFGEDCVELLHSGFISTDRVDKEKRLLQMIGKDAKRPYKKIIVGTQVIEQSLDIDFDLLISDLAPMDLLLQRLGRLHRHPSTFRPKELKYPVLYVLGTSDSFEFEKGSSHVYGDYLLMRTQYYLPNLIYIPGDISVLVQKVYDDNDLDLMEEDLKNKYTDAKLQMKNIISNKKTKAESYLLDKPKKSKDSRTESLIGWLRNANPNHSDERGFAQVRDSGDRIEVIVVKKCGNGYSFFHENEDISRKIADFDIGKKLATQTLKLPNRFSLDYNIDKTIEFLEKENREKLSAWQQLPWLKGSLGIIFDENNSYDLNGWKLCYNEKYGLEYEKEVENGAF